MTDHDLRNLRKIHPPKASPEAKQQAVLAAMSGFDDEFAQKNTETSQGLANEVRQSSIHQPIWRTMMSLLTPSNWALKPTHVTALTAALMLPVVGVVGWNVTQDIIGLAPVDETSVAAKKDVADAELGAVAPTLAEPAPTLAMREQNSPAPSPKSTMRNTASDGIRQRALMKRPAAIIADRDQARALQRRLSRPQQPVAQSENYQKFDDNGVTGVTEKPVSTFSIDVDTASYSRVRRMILGGDLPSRDMVRAEEMVNYFPYNYQLPESKSQPFKPTVTVMPTPWNEHTQLMHIGIKGFDLVATERPKANLVFLLDVSGSMNAPDKLPLLIKSFRLLLKKLKPDDIVSIVTYAGHWSTVLEAAKASEQSTITHALNNLSAGGSTAGAGGIERAYELAQKHFMAGGVNRVMLATDGDFNVGISEPDALKTFIADKRKSGVFLSVFGFGTGNYNDALMQALAQNGNGTAAYIDTLAEAQKTLVEQAGATLFPIAKDVKIQVEFNPAVIAEYRLIGYETRALAKEDFNNDNVDAGDIGAGHSVTAIYELTPVGSEAVLVDKPRYEGNAKPTNAGSKDEIAFIKMRYKLPEENDSKMLEIPVSAAASLNTFDNVISDVQFSVAVATFAQKLRGNSSVDGVSYEAIADMAAKARGDDKFGYRSAFVQLVRMAQSLKQSSATTPILRVDRKVQ